LQHYFQEILKFFFLLGQPDKSAILLGRPDKTVGKLLGQPDNLRPEVVLKIFLAPGSKKWSIYLDGFILCEAFPWAPGPARFVGERPQAISDT